MKQSFTTKAGLFLLIAVLTSIGAMAQGTLAPSYCTSISAANVAGYGMGIQNVTLNTSALPTQINNTTSPGTGTPIYFDYTSQVLRASANETVNYSIKGGSSNQTLFRIYIDYNGDGTFATTSPELVYTSANLTTSNTVVNGTFTIPSTVTPKAYRIRIASDGQGNIPQPCGPLVYSADFEDYTLLIQNSSVDVSATMFTSPSLFVIGNNTIGLRFHNLHSTTVTSADIGYQLNNNTPVTQSLSSISVAQGAAYTTNFSTSLNIASSGTYTLRAWVTNPNGNGTGVSSNDTIYTTFTVCDPFNGTYTINPSGSGPNNYTSFSSAISALQCGGVSGPVIFNVAAGTYNEQVTIPAINGASATNTITFQSASLVASSVTLTNNPTSNNWVLNLNGADYITLKRMTINNGNTGCCTNNTIQLGGGADYNTIRECIISNSYSSGTNGNLINVSNSTDNYNTIVGNTFNNGSYGINWNSNTSNFARRNVIDSNTFNNQYQYGIYSYYMDTVTIRNNTFTTGSATTYRGIYMYFQWRKPTITGNRFYQIPTGYAIDLSYFNYSGSSTNRGLVANNMIQVGNGGTGTCYGIGMTGNNYYTDVVHNTISVNNSTGAGAGIYISSTQYYCNVANNIASNSSTGTTAYALQNTSTGNMSTDTLNFNNYYSAGTNLINWGGTNYTAAQFASTAYQVAAGNRDFASKNKQVTFTSTTDLHHSSSCLFGAGTNAYFSLVGTDYDGVARNSTAPCIGGTEYTASAYDLNFTAVTAPTAYSGSPQTVSFTVRNNGSATITGFDAGYSVNYGTTVAQTFSSLSLGACDQTTLNFTTQVTLPSGISTLRTFNSGNLNGTNNDAVASNDTMYRQYNGGMSGTYTINGSLPPSSTNFQTFTAAIAAVSTSPGVSGAVTFNVAAGTYTEQLIIPAIPGSSTTNTVTFDGGTAANTIVTCAGSGSNYSVFRLSNTANVTLKNMTIRNTGGSVGWGVHVYTTTSGTSNLKVKNCIIKNTSNSSVTGTTAFAGIVASGSLTSATTSTGAVISAIELDSNTVDSAYYGIMVYSSTLYSSGVTIRKNTLTNIYFYGTYCYYLYGANVSNNTITLTAATSTTSSYGMYFQNCNTTGSIPTYINGNNIYGAGNFGIYLSSCTGSATAQCQLYNNMVRGGFRVSSAYGIYLTTVSYFNIYHNTSVMDFATTSTIYGPFYHTGGTTNTNNFRNNIFAYTATSGSGLAAYFSSSPHTIDYNNYYKFGATASTAVAYYAAWGNLTQSALAQASQNANSVSTNPNFTSATDLRVTEGCLLGANLGVTTDFEGDSRSTTPTMGADEYTRVNNDAGISALLYPSAPATPGTQNIIVTLKNYGLNTITAATVKYSVNNSSPVSVNWTGTLAACGTTSVTFTGANQYTFTGGTNVIKVWTEQPNTTSDGRASNDTNTTTLELCNGLSGSYTINPSGSGVSNYTSFAAAKTALVNCGVAGPVTFTVSAGTYTEQVLLTAISGASSTNTITFDGGTGNAATRILTSAGTSSTNAYTLRLNGSSYVRFRNMTIRNSGSSFANALHIMGSSHYAQIKNCIIEITGTGTTSTGSSYIPLIINNTADISSPSTGSQVNFLEIDSNTINSGYYNIFMYGSTSSPYSNSNKVRYNTMNSAYYISLLFYFQDGVRIQNNTIAMRSSGSSNSYGIQTGQSINTGTNYSEISGNRIYDAGGYGIYLSSWSTSASYRNKLYNNMIGGGFRTSSCYGIYLQSSSYADVWFNTVNIDYNGGSAGTAAFYSNSTSFIDIRNNAFVVSATTGSTVPVYINTVTDPSTFDYNNFANASGANLIYFGGTNLTASTYQNFGGFNANSQNYALTFTNATNLHHSFACLNGTNISFVTTDIDGNTRGTTPDIGADEITGGVTNDIGVFSVMSPGTSFAPGTQDVKVVIRNFGSNTITSASVSYTVNGGSTVTQSWTGSLGSCDTAIVTFTGANQFNFVANTTYSIVATVASPNGGADNNSSNNSLTVSGLLSGLSGAYTINPSGSGSTNYTTFALAVLALRNRGVAGPVTFTVSAATYNEQVTITSIPNISATNTVTFDGGSGNASTRILSWSSSTNSTDHTIKIDNTPYVTFKNLTINNGASSGQSFGICVHIYGSSHYTQIKNCIIQMLNTGSTSTTNWYHNILINSSPNPSNPSGATAYVNGLEIDSNTIRGGYTNIYFYSSTSSPFSTGNKFRKNNLINAYQYAAYFQYQDGIEFSNDSIYTRSGSTASYGLYMTNCAGSGSNKFIINGNKITNVYLGGLYLSTVTSANSSVRNQLVNNMVGGITSNTSPYGIYLASSTNFDVFFNSSNVNTAVTSAGYGAMYLSGGTGHDIRNNIFAMTSASATAPAFYSASTMSSVLLSSTAFNYNNYYMANSGTTNRAFYNGTTFTSSTLVGGGGYNSNSLVSANPSFTSATDLHITNTGMNGVTISGYSTDIDGATRVSPPDMGADEIPNPIVSLNMSLDSLVSPGTPNNTVGSTTVAVRLKNLGTTTLTGTTMKYTINGGSAVSESWTGSLAQNDTATFTFSTAFTTTLGTVYSLKVWSEAPNGGSDAFTNNDTITQTVSPKMNGIYTVNASGSGATNFTTFALCSTALAVNGVSGPVTINVAPATYTGQVIIPAISGASAVNTVTIDGGSASTTILTAPTTTVTTTHTIRLNGTSFVNLRNLTIRGTNATYGWPLHIMNSNNIKVRNCAINFVGATNSLPTSTNFHAVVVNNSTSSYTTAYAASNIDIDSNSIRGGYSGIYFAGSASTGINCRNNTFDSCYFYGAYYQSINGVVVNNNTINMNTGTTSNYGIYLSSCTASGTNYHQINGNLIRNAGNSGIYLISSNNPALYKGQMYNNMVTEGFRTTGGAGINSNSSAYWNIYYNTINFDQTSGYALYVSNSGHDVRNNMLVCSATSGSAYPFYTNSTSFVTQLDYNNYYNAQLGASGLVNLAGTIYSSSTYIGAQGYNTYAKNLAPGFTGTRDLHLTNSCFNGATPISGLTLDIDGNSRSATAPEIGADEVIAANNNTGVDAVVSPTAPLTAGTQDVVVRIKNYGGNTLTSANVSYKVNGGTAKTIAWTGSLAPCDTISVYFTGANQYNFASGGSYSIKAYTDGPNGTTDANANNDTVTTSTYCTGMSGAYTINPGGSGATNYTTFADAVAALQCGGVNGPVTFTVSAGTYSEQVIIPSISGASATNTITFDGGTAAGTILDFSASSTTAAHTVRIDNASYITLRNLTLHGSGGTYANTLHIYGSCNYIKVKNCVIDITGAGTVSTSTNFVPVIINGSTSVSNSTGSRPTNLEIDSNTIQFGYYGIVSYALTSAPHASNFKFRKNTLDSTYLYGIYANNYIDTIYVNSNTVNLRISGGTTSAAGIYLQSTGGFGSSTFYCEIMGNKIINPGSYGIFAAINSTSSAVRSKVINNMIGGGFRSTTSYGFYASSFYNIDFFYNTVNHDAATTAEQYASAYFTSCQNLDVRNNVLSVSNTSATGLPFYSTNSVTYTGFNYNNFYKAGTVTNLLYSLGAAQTPGSFVGSSGYNINSINRSVAFTSNTDLHSTDAACFNGTNISSVTTDFDGQTRGGTPDMGADENLAYSNDVAVDAIVTPVAPLTAGIQDVKIRIRNPGNNTITAATVNYKVNGGTATTINWTGTLLPCDTVTVTFTGANQYNFASGGTYAIQAYTSGVNSTTDPNASNDTINGSSMCTGYGGTYTINPSGSGSTNFTTFGAAVSALSCGGVTGPVTFNVSSGTYNEQIIIPSINGTSAANTITFQAASGNAADVTLTYNATTSTDNYTVRFNGADYITLEKMTIAATNTSFGHVIEFTNTATYDSINACILNGIATTSTSTNYALVFSNSTRDNFSVVHNSTLNYGSFGIYWQSATSLPYTTNVSITDNTFNNISYQAIYMYFHSKSYIKGNTINLHNGTAGTFYGIYELNCWNGTRIIKNRIIGSTNSSTTTYGISSYQPTGTSSDSGLVANNVIAISQTSGTVYGLYSYLPQWSKVYYNSVNITGTATTVYASYLFSNSATYSNNTAWNNIFVNRCTGANASAMYFYNTGLTSYYLSNYNNLFSSGTNIGHNNGTGSTTLTAWRTSSGTPDVNSTNFLPGFTSATDLHHTTPCISNTGFAGANVFVSDDADGTTRGSAPDVGAYEFTGNAYDGAAGNITAPTSWLGSAQTVSFRIINRGSTTITSITAGYNVNSGTATTQTFTGLNIAACDSAVLSFSTQVTLSAGQNVLRTFVAGTINGSNNDALSSNDTNTVTICNALSGTFTINAGLPASGTNFQSFNSAITALTACGGISGAVTFNVAAGTYNEQVTIPAIGGASATNTITFNGADSATTIINYNTSNSASRYVVKFNNARFVTFRNFRISSPNITQAWGIHITGSSVTDTSIRIARCSVIIPNINSSNFAGIVVSNSTTNPNTTGHRSQAITIDSCSVTGGYYGITMMGYTSSPNLSPNNIIRGCVINNNSFAAIYATYSAGLVVMGNTISNTGVYSSSTSTYGIYLNICDSFKVTKNVITGQLGGSAIYCQSNNGIAASHNLIANNMIQIGTSSNSSYGINIQSGAYHDVVYNSVNITSTGVTSTVAALQVWTPTNTQVLNNNFVNLNSGYVVYAPFWSSSYFSAMDYNNYYGLGTNPINGSYANATAMLNAIYTGSDANSKSVNPGFVSSTNLHTPSAGSLNAAATPFALVTDDIDGTTRNATTPDIGCDEFTPPSEDIGATVITKPATPVAQGATDVYVVIKNYGATTVTSANVSYKVGVTTVTQAWTGSLATNAIDTVKFTATSGPGSTNQQYTVGAGSTTMYAFTDQPNAISDGNTGNDTTTLTFCAALTAGTYTINPSGSGSTNYTTIAAAISALTCGGVSGPVVFNISSGTYTGQYIIPAIAGASSTNTITFQSATGVASAVTLQNNSTLSTANYIVRLNGADYVTFSRLTFAAQNATYGQCIELVANGADQATNNSVRLCVLNALSTGSNCRGITTGTTSNTPNNLTVYGNTFLNGFYGIYLYGVGYTSNSITGLTVDSNFFGTNVSNSPSSGTMYLYYATAPQITRNTLYGRSASTTGVGIYYGSGNINVSRNIFQFSSGGYAIDIQNANQNSETSGGSVVNNAISLGRNFYRTRNYYWLQRLNGCCLQQHIQFEHT
jgi:parallel beta-helix repeat protein